MQDTTIKKFENLNAWIVAKELAILAYRATKTLPKAEIFGLTSQINRAAVSVSANIAEGSSRTSAKDFNRFLDIALGSAFELKTLMEIAYSQKLAIEFYEQINEKIVDCVKLIYGLKRSIR